ncbi:Hydrogenase transcriptional regulatory protein hupR1 [Rubripirellula tenax]|uniref:Hydrogenase transcriptional regulatory protein hupR1 n=1 Tax=Rubripirellula tenax TaxID=2528015 RepID=A0A5C6FDB1_9BACT|nr:response regulator [Rubripirellula tenax]TWU58732.1 Hydrogenase transcriptional regulatory protein hupR1 [Rubripirellula tenax]
MSKQILFVDDDPSLLSTMKRNLGCDYTVHTAEGAEMALKTVSQQGHFSVVIVDMQMPKINGVETIKLLREQMPDAVFVMLTGNQDVTTAINALNEGQVFRFLNKPCKTTEISAVIDAAQKQHNLLIAEKELLSGTFAGAIKLMTDVIEMQEHQPVDTGRMAASLEELASRMSIETGWEEKVAARVFTLGIAMLDTDQKRKFLSLDPTDDEHKRLFGWICKQSATLISRLPRMAWIVDTLKAVPAADRLETNADRQAKAATLLRIVFYWNFLTNRGLSVEATTSHITKLMPNLGTKLVQEIQCLNDNRDSHVVKSVHVSKLRPGMICQTDITLPGVGTVVKRGLPLTAAMVDNLVRCDGSDERKIQVIENSMVGVL